VKVGDFVINKFQGIYRYGKILKSYPNYNNDGWSWFDVEWVDDESYEKAISNRNKMTNQNFSMSKYRADNLTVFNLNNTLQTLLKLQNIAE
jgi:hypothetical protein